MRSIVFFVALIACERGAKHDDAPPMQPPSQPDAVSHTGPRVVFATPNGDVAVDVEVVATEPKIERGLMYRQHMPPDEGMLFLMVVEKVWTFWMRNTLIPLDMIFIRTDMTIAGIVENAEPKTDTLRSVGELSRYVLEVNAGWTRTHGVVKNARVRFENLPKR